MKKLYPYLFILIITGCREKYTLPYTGPSKGYLVVEGYINAGQGPTSIHLSRTLALVDTVNRVNETGATINVQGENSGNFLLQDKGAGLYAVDQLLLDNNQRYRLYIKTQDGKEYISSYSTVKLTPPIDTLTWKRNDGVEIFVNTHDDNNKTIYYRWEYDETWEFNSRYFSSVKLVLVNPNLFHYRATFKFLNGGIDTSIDNCWKYNTSKNILIGSSETLSRDSIHYSLFTIPPIDQRLGVLYSMLVKQYAISKDEFEFLRRMKKNTEQVGSLFDAQPSELNGNLHCITNPAEVVIGYVGITSVKQKRMFIKRSEVPGWGYIMPCNQEEVTVVNDPDSIIPYINLMPTTEKELTPLGAIYSFGMASPFCVDCTLSGTNVKPAFWP